jgi:hypothetical protein
MKEKARKTVIIEPLDAEKVNVSRDHYFPDAYVIDLLLDSTPDHIWLDIFEREWKTSRQLWDRKIFIIADRLRLITTAYELEEKLDWVKQVVARTNAGVAKYNRELVLQVAQLKGQLRKQTVKEDEEKASLELIRETLRKKFGAS